MVGGDTMARNSIRNYTITYNLSSCNTSLKKVLEESFLRYIKELKDNVNTDR